MMIGMRIVRPAGSPNGSANPRKSRENHVYKGAIHENLNHAVPVTELHKEQTESAIVQAEDKPRDEARSQQMAGHVQKSKNGDQREKTKKYRSSDVALQGEAIKDWNAIGKKQPGGEDQSQADTGVDANANRHVVEDVEPTVTGQMCANQHAMLGSQDANDGPTRNYDDGGVTSMVTGALGALSFPARSTAVTVYQ